MLLLLDRTSVSWFSYSFNIKKKRAWVNLFFFHFVIRRCFLNGPAFLSDGRPRSVGRGGSHLSSPLPFFFPTLLSLLLVVRIKPSMRGFFIRKYTIITRSATAYNKSCIRFFPNGLFVFFLLGCCAVIMFLFMEQIKDVGRVEKGRYKGFFASLSDEQNYTLGICERKKIDNWMSKSQRHVHRFPSFFLHRRH